jgi:hypothetical protein
VKGPVGQKHCNLEWLKPQSRANDAGHRIKLDEVWCKRRTCATNSTPGLGHSNPTCGGQPAVKPEVWGGMTQHEPETGEACAGGKETVVLAARYQRTGRQHGKSKNQELPGKGGAAVRKSEAGAWKPGKRWAEVTLV